MKDKIKITVIFNSELIDKTKTEIKSIIYSKQSDEKKKNKLAESLEKKAAEDSVIFQKRKLSKLFNPVFKGFIMFSDEIKLGEGGLIDFAGLFFKKVEKDFAVNIINYSLKGIKDLNFFEFEIFNYNFDEHKAIKSEFVKPQNVKKIAGVAESILKGLENNNIKKTKNAAKSVEKVKKAGLAAGKTGYKTPAALKVHKTGTVKSGRADEKEEFRPDLSGESEICEAAAVKNAATEHINLISMNWSLLSSSENIPVLEAGEPAEIYRGSLVRIYFQKPNVRQVVWRFRKKPKMEGLTPILRVYEGSGILWYETLDGFSGSRYIIFPDDFELSSTWVEIGYLTSEGRFIFIARSPVWPPSCLLKTLPKLNLRIKLPKRIRLIGLGATESLSDGMSGGGFSGSGAGIEK